MLPGLLSLLLLSTAAWGMGFIPEAQQRGLQDFLKVISVSQKTIVRAISMSEPTTLEAGISEQLSDDFVRRRNYWSVPRSVVRTQGQHVP